MEFFEFLTIVIVLVVLPAVIFEGIRKIKETKYKGERSEGDSLRMSELQAMIEIAVEDAVAPLQQRIEELEAIQPAGLLEAQEAYDDYLDAEEEAEAPAVRRIRTGV